MNATLDDIARLIDDKLPEPEPQPVDCDDAAALADAITKVMKTKSMTVFVKRRNISDLVIKVLLGHGFLCQSDDGQFYYFDQSKHALYNLDDARFQRDLANTSGLATVEAEFAFVIDRLKSLASIEPPRAMHVFGYFDKATGALAVAFGGSDTYRYARGSRKWVHVFNGDGLLFLTTPDATACEPEFGTSGNLEWFIEKFLIVGRIVVSREDQQALLLVWLYQQFFPAQTRMLLTLLGTQGSGKTTAARAVGRLLLGPLFQVSHISKDHQDGMVASLTNGLMLCADNLDTRNEWLEDTLCTYSTGSQIERRELYHTNRLVRFTPRAVLMITSRDPHFKRPDVAERILPIHFDKPADTKYVADNKIYEELQTRRPAILGELLTQIAEIADSMEGVEAPSLPFRMADFAEFGWHAFNSQGRADEWESLLGRLEESQIAFASEDDVILQFLRVLLDNKGDEMSGLIGHVKEIETKGLIGPIDGSALFEIYVRYCKEHSLPAIKSPQVFGQKLTSMKRMIVVRLNSTVDDARGHADKRVVTIRRNQEEIDRIANLERATALTAAKKKS